MGFHSGDMVCADGLRMGATWWHYTQQCWICYTLCATICMRINYFWPVQHKHTVYSHHIYHIFIMGKTAKNYLLFKYPAQTKPLDGSPLVSRKMCCGLRLRHVMVHLNHIVFTIYTIFILTFIIHLCKRPIAESHTWATSYSAVSFTVQGTHCGLISMNFRHSFRLSNRPPSLSRLVRARLDHIWMSNGARVETFQANATANLLKSYWAHCWQGAFMFNLLNDPNISYLSNINAHRSLMAVIPNSCKVGSSQKSVKQHQNIL